MHSVFVLTLRIYAHKKINHKKKTQAFNVSAVYSLKYKKDGDLNTFLTAVLGSNECAEARIQLVRFVKKEF